MTLVKTAMLLGLMTALFMGIGWALGGRDGMLVALLFAAAMNLWSWWNSGKAVLRMHRAVEIDRRNAPELFRVTEELSARAGMPMPRVYLIQSKQPNAFATGRGPEDGAVAVTTGLLELLSEEEVAAVIAHELAHIENRDTLTMTIAATLAGAVSMLGNFAFFFGGNRNNPLGGLGVILAMIVAPFAAGIVQMAISRTREYSADRRGAEIVGRPLWLASALRRIAVAAGRLPNMAAERAPSTAHMFIINPLNGDRADNLFSTHPSTENRIMALEELAASPNFMPAGAPKGRLEQDSESDAAIPGPWGSPQRGPMPGRAQEHPPIDARPKGPRTAPSIPPRWGRNARG